MIARKIDDTEVQRIVCFSLYLLIHTRHTQISVIIDTSGREWCRPRNSVANARRNTLKCSIPAPIATPNRDSATIEIPTSSAAAPDRSHRAEMDPIKRRIKQRRLFSARTIYCKSHSNYEVRNHLNAISGHLLQNFQLAAGSPISTKSFCAHATQFSIDYGLWWECYYYCCVINTELIFAQADGNSLRRRRRNFFSHAFHLIAEWFNDTKPTYIWFDLLQPDYPIKYTPAMTRYWQRNGNNDEFARHSHRHSWKSWSAPSKRHTIQTFIRAKKLPWK